VADTKYTEDVGPLFKKSQEVAGKRPKTLVSDDAINFMEAHKKNDGLDMWKIKQSTYAIFISKVIRTQTKWRD